MRFILTRHGETGNNALGLVYGDLPSALTKKGRRQAEQLAQKLKDTEFTRIFCSDLERCIETAQIVHDSFPDIPIAYSKLLREQKQGSLFGKHARDVDWHHLPPDVETPIQMAERSKEFLARFDFASGDSILIISHRRFLNTFINVLLGQSPDYESPAQLVDNSSVTIIDSSRIGEGKLISVNDTKHLAK